MHETIIQDELNSSCIKERLIMNKKNKTNFQNIRKNLTDLKHTYVLYDPNTEYMKRKYDLKLLDEFIKNHYKIKGY